MAVTRAVLEKWMAAQRRHRLSDKQVQMARELGLNPDKLGKTDNHRQEPWKAPLPQFIEDIYFKRFKREEPETVRPLKQILKEIEIRKQQRKRKRTDGSRNGMPPLPCRRNKSDAGLHIPLHLLNVGDAGGFFMSFHTRLQASHINEADIVLRVGETAIVDAFRQFVRCQAFHLVKRSVFRVVRTADR